MSQPTREQLLASIRKDFGEQSMFILGQNEKLMSVELRSSGSLVTDVALGGGFAKGRLVLLRGAEKAGKTTIASLAIGEAQRVEPERENALIDLENSFNPTWARTLGVDVDRLFISQPDTYAEKIYEMILALLRTKQFAYIVLDSTDGLMLKSEMENDDFEKETRVGGTSKLNSHAMRKLVNSGELKNSGSTLIFIQQLRDKIGGFSMYGTPTDSSGGRAFKHNSSQTLDVSVGEFFAKGAGDTRVVLGQQSKIKISKNKVAAPFKQASLDLYYEGGLDRYKELVTVAKEINVLSGTSWVTFIDPRTGDKQLDAAGEEIKFNGKDKARDALIDNIENGNGEYYARILDMVNSILRG
jgi:recombination protein RecA